ncbi:MAG: DUF192 domain-containing protein [Patulibacter sp.]|nr:DUF192 domain-containing protein [Patulibacter sp.]
MRRIEASRIDQAWHTTAADRGWRIERARTRRERARGLLGRSGLAPRHGLWIGTRSVHMVGMRFAIDLIWIDRRGAVRRVDRDVRPGRMRTCLAASGGVVEVGAGDGPCLAALLAESDAARLRADTHRAAGGPDSGPGTARRPPKHGRAA